jgi:hypothetical protein
VIFDLLEKGISSWKRKEEKVGMTCLREELDLLRHGCKLGKEWPE